MGENSSDILYQLKSAGHRITEARKLIVGIFTAARKPLSAQEIITALTKKGRNVNKTTVYREIESLTKAKLIRDVNLLDGQLRYELIKDTQDHSHLVCTECKNVECLPLLEDLQSITSNIAKKNKFTVTHHVLEFFGVCKECR